MGYLKSYKIFENVENNWNFDLKDIENIFLNLLDGGSSVEFYYSFSNKDSSKISNANLVKIQTTIDPPKYPSKTDSSELNIPAVAVVIKSTFINNDIDKINSFFEELCECKDRLSENHILYIGSPVSTSQTISSSIHNIINKTTFVYNFILTSKTSS